MHLTWKDAGELIGKITTIELKHVDARGKPVLYEHAYGRVKTADPKEGFFIELLGLHEGKTLALPANIKNFAKAARGLYRMRTSGEEIEDPDFMSTWTFHHRDRIEMPTPKM